MLQNVDVTRVSAKRSFRLVASLTSLLAGVALTAATWATAASESFGLNHSASKLNEPDTLIMGRTSDSSKRLGRMPHFTFAERGESGQLLARYRDGDEPGIMMIAGFAMIVPRSTSESRKGKLGGYYLGEWPKVHKASLNPDVYAPPEGLVEVTPENAETNVSAHFRLRDFLTKDQFDVWPKYVAIDLDLIDKLELVLADLKKRHSIDPAGVRVMSGFRTPRYNAKGGDPRGRASMSRHMYGAAADIYIDNDGNGKMDDLNKDGRVDIRDAKLILAAVERVEEAYPSLVGGAGTYRGTVHGPFIHIDIRGKRARW